IAETCVAAIAKAEYEKLVAKWGEPTVAGGPRTGERSRPAILALGKLGGHELNYHSDLDLVFLYEADGPTFHGPRARRNATTTTNQHFYSELGQRIVKICTRLGPYGKLYEVDLRLRPTGKSGALATTFDEFARYFAEGAGQLWERQALTKARVAIAPQDIVETLSEIVARAAYDHPWQSANAEAIRDMRRRMEENAPANNIKRGPGGIVDIEFIVQMLQLKHGRQNAAIRSPNTLAALSLLHQHGYLNSEDYEYFTTSYRLLRTVESRLRLMQAPTRVLPDDPIELTKLAGALGYADGAELQAECRRYLRRNRERFDVLIAAEAQTLSEFVAG
ncbi:MAG: hypothetical protein B7Z73_18205, partial [Planctomycetia bacterium 21-64-5]